MLSAPSQSIWRWDESLVSERGPNDIASDLVAGACQGGEYAVAAAAAQHHRLAACMSLSFCMIQRFDAMWQELSRAVKQATPRLRPRSIIIVLHAFSQYELPSSGLAPALAKALEPHLSGLS